MANKIKKEELELMSYNDIAHLILKDKPKQTTLNIFKKIVKMLGLSESALENKIGEFYTALTNDKRFILLDGGKWDLKENHKSVSLTNDDDLEDFDEDGEDYDDAQPEQEEDDMFEETDDDVSDVTEEYKNLVIVDEDDLDGE